MHNTDYRKGLVGAAAVIAVFHTVLVTLGLFSFFQIEINLTVIAALLTLVGFDVNDSIVIFDRIRENRKLHRRMSLYDVTNLSINQTLSRTVITSGLVFLSVIALVLLGGQTLRPFSLALLMGIIFGTYDTIAVAGPIMVWWERRLEAANKQAALTSPRPGVTYFGIEDPSQALPELQHAFDAKYCRRCGAPYEYERAFVGHLGHYRCPSCGADRPAPDVAATRIELEGMRGSRTQVRTPDGEVELRLRIPGLYNVYNALAALAAAQRLGLALPEAARAMEEMRAVFGRVETVRVAGKDLSMLLIKNPAGANEVIRTLLLEARANGEPTLDLWVGLNDRIADGRDISWVWDADFELLAGHVRQVTCAGTRAPEMAVRLKYAGIAPEAIEVAPGITQSIDRAVDRADGRLFALPTYTALLELRTLLSKRGLARDYWE